MKLFNSIFYLLLVGSCLLYSCETEAPETINANQVEVERMITEFVSLQSEAQEGLNIVADVLLRNNAQIQAATTTPDTVSFDDCSAKVYIQKTTSGAIEIKIAYESNGCLSEVSQKERSGTITVEQSGTTSYLKSGHEMLVNFDSFRMGTKIITGKITVKNVSTNDTTFSLTDTVKQQLTYDGFGVNDAGTITSGYQERGLISGLASRSIGDDIYLVDATLLNVTGVNKDSYIVKDSTNSADMVFDFTCWSRQIYYPTKGYVKIMFSAEQDSANVDFGSGACDPFKTITF